MTDELYPSPIRDGVYVDEAGVRWHRRGGELKRIRVQSCRSTGVRTLDDGHADLLRERIDGTIGV